MYLLAAAAAANLPSSTHKEDLSGSGTRWGSSGIRWGTVEVE